ncbi:hypothetical protein JOD63_002273 [Microbacterium terrae]|uniref:polysaccharide pyruvyl transferase family protein n=1 Tax=Microbacterium terrae TaxID=69369 RepID=UPI0005EC3372|nr:polysaccharide pyruvyl transferase family protein [Microbacterium terrae]MBP1078305.1 hypothetical protein [Microbacterium terrae]GLJ97784.1 hypothetical protein GCM10017594_09810 [Microbacterium terrae]
MSSSLDDVIVCSFYTDDDYYRGWARTLEQNLDELGIGHVLREVHPEAGQDWADICRQKVAFLDQVCRENPDKRVYWTDVDCQILQFPEYLHTFTADVIGFQHGFAGPMEIGYKGHTRFWAPSFIGVNTTPIARKFVADAAKLERESSIKATDDYFFEESWRANADLMSFQIIPAGAVLGRGNGNVEAFFKFGSSGNVPEFRNKVVQHTAPGSKTAPGSAASNGHRTSGRIVAARTKVRMGTYKVLKGIDDGITKLAPDNAERLREWAKQQPLVHRVRPTTPPKAQSHRARLLAQATNAGQKGNIADLEDISTRLATSGVLTTDESATLAAAQAFAEYALSGDQGAERIPLMWWTRPSPGNFGDWVSPLVVTRTAGRGVSVVPTSGTERRRHLVSVGSIARFTNENSIVIGTGASAESAELHPDAHYHSLRGPLTAALLRDRGGRTVDSFGDPALLLRRLIPVDRPASNGRLLLVRHFTHANLPVTLPDDMDEESVYRSSPADHSAFLAKLNEYDGVVTSAMHVMIACHSYGIPVTLIGFRGFEDTVSGSGMKYRDYSEGAALERNWEPVPMALNLGKADLRSRLEREYVSDTKLDEVEAAVRAAVADWRNSGD